MFRVITFMENNLSFIYLAGGRPAHFSINVLTDSNIKRREQAAMHTTHNSLSLTELRPDLIGTSPEKVDVTTR